MSASCTAGSNGWPMAEKPFTPCFASACSSVERTIRTPFATTSSSGAAASARSRPSSAGSRSFRIRSFPNFWTSSRSRAARFFAFSRSAAARSSRSCSSFSRSSVSRAFVCERSSWASRSCTRAASAAGSPGAALASSAPGVISTPGSPASAGWPAGASSPCEMRSTERSASSTAFAGMSAWNAPFSWLSAIASFAVIERSCGPEGPRTGSPHHGTRAPPRTRRSARTRGARRRPRRGFAQPPSDRAASAREICRAVRSTSGMTRA